MGKMSIREAVKHYNVSRPTLTKALKSGKISGAKDGKGKWSIDPSELARVYQPRPTSVPSQEPAKMRHSEDLFTTLNTSNPSEIDQLKNQLAEIELRVVKAETRADAAELLAKERAERIEDLRRMLPSPDEHKKRRWWHRG